MEIRFTKRELDIMGALWAQGPSTVGEVREALEDDLAYNTVLTMLKIMEGKGYVSLEPRGSGAPIHGRSGAARRRQERTRPCDRAAVRGITRRTSSALGGLWIGPGCATQDA